MEPKVADVAKRERLLQAAREWIAREGTPPGLRRFAEATGEKKGTWQGILWSSWGEFLRQVGSATASFTQAIPDDALLQHLADLTRELRRFPSVAQVKVATKRRPGVPSEKTLRNRFGRVEDMLSALRAWVAERPEYSDIAHLLEGAATTAPARATKARAAATDHSQVDVLSDSFLPPIVASLPLLASADARAEQICAERGLALNVEFERRVGVAFALLGLNVEQLGQGTGRVADGIARCVEGRWALVYDAKVRRGGFVMGTEDRKFREYVERHAEALKREGIDKVYFTVISSSFADGDLRKANELVRQTQARACVLLPAELLRDLVDLRLRSGPAWDLVRLERVFASSAIVTRERLEESLR